jgi:hypothetical protein
LDGRVYSWAGLHLASNGSMDCSKGFKAVYADAGAPCAHAMLEVWPAGQEAAYSEYVLGRKTVEDGGALGVVGETGWWATQSALEADPLLSSVRGMRTGASMPPATHVFRRPLTFGEYCNHTYAEWSWVATAYGGEPYNLNASVPSHFCAHVFRFAVYVEFGLTYPTGVDWTRFEEDSRVVDFLSKRASMVARCSANTGSASQFAFYALCPKYWLVGQDLHESLAAAEVELNRAGYPPVQLFYYRGFFRQEADLKGVLQSTTGCPDGADAIAGAPGAHPWPQWGDADGYSRFPNADPDIVASHGLELRPLSMRSELRAALEVSGRLLAEDAALGSPVLLSTQRPNSLFLRSEYRVNETWGNYTGPTFALGKVQLPEWGVACARAQRQFADRCEAGWSPPAAGGDGSTAPVQCGYPDQVLFKAFASKLKDYSPEAFRFLRRFQLTRDDQERMLAEVEFGGTSLPHPARAREVACAWVRANEARWRNWLPLTSDQVRCVGELGDPFAVESPDYSPSLDAVVECSGHGVCVRDDAAQLRLSPNAGECRCERGYIGEDCSGLVDPESLNVQFLQPAWVVVTALQALTLAYTLFLLHHLGKHQFTSTVLRTSHPLVLRIALLAVLAATAGVQAWAGPTNSASCLARPLLVSVPFGLVLAVINVKLARKKLRLAVNDEDVWASVRPAALFYLALFFAWALLFTPHGVEVRLEDRVWLKYSACAYGPTQAAFEALLLATALYAGVTNAQLAWELRLKPSYFNEGRDLLRTSLALAVLPPTAWLAGQAVTSPLELEKFLLTTLATLASCWLVLALLVRPKFVFMWRHPGKNNLKDGLFHPTGDPGLAVGDPTADMARTIAAQDDSRRTRVRAALGLPPRDDGDGRGDSQSYRLEKPRAHESADEAAGKRRGSVLDGLVGSAGRQKLARARGSVAAIIPPVVRRATSAGLAFAAGSRVGEVLRRGAVGERLRKATQVAPINEHEKVHNENIDALHAIDAFPSPVLEVGIDPASLHDPNKRGLAYRSPEMYVVLERRLKVVQRENVELTRIIEEHRIDPVTGEMDEDFMDALHRIKSEHRKALRELDQKYAQESAALDAERKEERAMLIEDKRRAVDKLETEKQEAELALRSAHQADLRKMRELEREHRRVVDTLRGTLPGLERFLQSYGLQEYLEGLKAQGLDSTEKLILASKDDMQAAGVRVGHIRKLQSILRGLEVATPMVLMPDGAVKARVKPAVPNDGEKAEQAEEAEQAEQAEQAERAADADGDEADEDENEDESKSRRRGSKRAKKRKLRLQHQRQQQGDKSEKREPTWIKNKDPTTGRRYLINPLTGESKWDEQQADARTHGQPLVEDVFSDSDDEAAAPRKTR